MRRRKTWIAVTCMLSLTLAGSLFGNHAFAADGNGIGEHIGHAATETTTSIEEEPTEVFTNAGNVATLPVPDAEESSNTERKKFIFADKKSTENEEKVCYLSTAHMMEDLKDIWENNKVIFYQNYGKPAIDNSGIPFYEPMIGNTNSFFLMDDSEIHEGDSVYISVDNENVSFFKEEDVVQLGNVEGINDVPDGEISLTLSRDGKSVEVDATNSSNVKIDKNKAYDSNYGLANREGTNLLVKRVNGNCTKTQRGQCIVEEQGDDNFVFCNQDIIALKKDIFGTEKQEDYKAAYDFACNNIEETNDFALFQTNGKLLLAYNGELEASTENTTQTSITVKQSSDTVTETVLEANQEEASSAITSQTASEEKQETVSNESKKYKWISIGLLCAFVLIGAGWILVPPILKKNKKK